MRYDCRPSDPTAFTPTGACDPTAVRPPCLHMFMTLLVGGGLGILAGLAWGLRRMLGRREQDDLGTISDSWVNQHRANTHDQSR
jgi:hypothetical protein